MECLDIQLCQLLTDNHNEILIAQAEVSMKLSDLNNTIALTNGYLFFGIVAIISYFIIRWIFNLVKSTALGW